MTPAPRSTWSNRWWLEYELILLLLLVFVSQFLRLDALSLRGEESRRAIVAMEMLRSGDWLVPRRQGENYFSRPPLQNWLIAGVAWLRGDCDIWAARFPSALATLLTALLVYGYSRTFLSRVGAFASAAAFATFAQIIHLGGLAETEAVFTLFVAGSLLVWHWGYVQEWPAARMWMTAYIFVALGVLTKGPQAPVYFLATVGVFLLASGQMRRFFTRSHVTGMLAFCVIFGAWLLPYALRMGLKAVKLILWQNAALRFSYSDSSALLQGLVSLPLETAACLLPWSVLLLLYLRRDFQQRIGDAHSSVRFLLICLIVTFPSCWFAAGARSRYWMPLYPCVAPLIGLVVQRCIEAPADSLSRKSWARFLSLTGVLLLGILILALTGNDLQLLTGLPLSQPLLMTVGLCFAVGAALVLLFSYRWENEPLKVQLAVFALAGAIGLSYSTWYLNILISRSIDTQRAVAVLKDRIVKGRMVSFDYVHHLFVYWYGGNIPRRLWPSDEADLPEDVHYFCFNARQPPPSLPFAWERVAVINCDRNVRRHPQMLVVVGRRLSEDVPH